MDKILWATRKGKKEWQEEIITEKEKRIPAALVWAYKEGYDRFRIAEFDGERPDFSRVLD
jgi:hypothetical protein